MSCIPTWKAVHVLYYTSQLIPVHVLDPLLHCIGPLPQQLVPQDILQVQEPPDERVSTTLPPMLVFHQYGKSTPTQTLAHVLHKD